MTNKASRNFPFTAIVGQEAMKQALILNVIYPQIGGVLIRGEKGTAKSTAVRSLEDILGGEKVVINLPLSSTEDRVVGTLDMEHALKTGEKKFEPGLLARAHGNILYVDEVNLLEDHMVDLLLDAAAMGVNTIEREGISHTHESRFILTGTMNPEEGDLRPQLVDRFGLVVDVAGETDVDLRAEVVRRRLVFEENPEKLLDEFAGEQKALGENIDKAIERLGRVDIPYEILRTAARIGIACEIDGHRADITLIKAAKALAAYRNMPAVTPAELSSCVPLVLTHRMRRKPFEERQFDMTMVDSLL